VLIHIQCADDGSVDLRLHIKTVGPLLALLCCFYMDPILKFSEHITAHFDDSRTAFYCNPIIAGGPTR
jgi:hypothetical protein